MVIEKAYLVTLKGELVNAYYRAGYTDEDIAKFWNEEIAKQIAEAVHIRLQAPSALKVEARPVKQGKWIYVGSVRSWDEIKCSACNSAFSTEDRDLILNWDFCPHCGARMDGEP